MNGSNEVIELRGKGKDCCLIAQYNRIYLRIGSPQSDLTVVDVGRLFIGHDTFG
jgi:hypothetical protein